MHGLRQDLRGAARLLRRDWPLTLAATVCFSLGIGGNTAIFSAVHGILLTPLPYLEPDRLVWVWGTWNDNPDREPLSDPDFLDLRTEVTSFASTGALLGDERVILGGAGRAESVRMRRVSAGYLATLSPHPDLGRFFRPEDEQAGRGAVVVLSHGLWQRRFADQPDPVGASLLLDGVEHQVIGVLPAGFQDLADEPDLQPDLWLPLRLDRTASRGMHRLLVIARLRRGAGRERAKAELQALAGRLAALHPETNRGKSWRLEDLHEGLVHGARRGLLILFGAVGLVLLIACANVASLLLARAGARERETAVRTALGAGNWHLLRQSSIEGLLLGGLGGALGLVLALFGTRALVRVAGRMLPLSEQIAVDTGVLGFTVGMTVLAGLACALFPWIASRRSDPAQVLQGARGQTARHGRLSRALVTVEVALALVVAVAATLLTETFLNVRSIDPGFRSQGLLVAHLQLPKPAYPHAAQATDLFARLLERTRSLPGVGSASLADAAPLSPYLSCFGFEVAGHPPFPPENAPCADLRAVGPGYFATVDIPVLSGRTPQRVAEGAEPEAVVNHLFASQIFAGSSPLGQRVGFADRTYTIVGVVGDSRTASLSYEPILQVYRLPGDDDAWSLYLVVRTRDRAERLMPLLRGELTALDAGLAFDSLQPVDRAVARSVGSQRARSVLMGLFALIALVLAAVGTYAVLSQLVRQRTREIGIRVALGAGSSKVVALVLRQGLAPVLLGLGLGLAAALASAKLLSGLLFEASAFDPRTLGVVALLVAGAALLACWFPARRALATDPGQALDQE